MPFFNFRRGGANSSSGASGAAAAVSLPAASAEVLRRRAKHRLIGAAVLVLLGVVGFPMLFDTQPRPIAVDIPIVIPGKATVPPLIAPSAVATAPAASLGTASVPAPSQAEKVAAAASLTAKEEIISSKQAAVPLPTAPPAIKSDNKPEKKPELRSEPKPDSKPEVRAEPKPEPKPAPKPVPKPPVVDDAARARALLNGTAEPTLSTKAPAIEGDARLIVQVGAFADAAKANEARVKLERAGLKTYTQVADTKDGKRTRVRVGPFASRVDAEKAASKIKGLDLPAAILTL